MKLLIIIATLGLATFVVVLRRRNPEFAERVDGAVKNAKDAAAQHVDTDAASDLAERVRDKAKSVTG
jgi:hypothetical protein